MVVKLCTGAAKSPPDRERSEATVIVLITFALSFLISDLCGQWNVEQRLFDGRKSTI